MAQGGSAQQQASGRREQAATTRSDAQGQRGAQQDQNREDWQQHQSQQQEDRQQSASQRQEDRQDFYEDEVQPYGGYRYYGSGWEDDDFAAGMVTGFVVGTTLSMAAAQSMSSSPQASCTMTTVPVAGATYYQCGPNWYQKSYTEGEVTFVVVAPPPGY
jgi:hypothetical protein